MSTLTLEDIFGKPNQPQFNFLNNDHTQKVHRKIISNPLVNDYLFGREAEIIQAYSQLPKPTDTKKSIEGQAAIQSNSANTKTQDMWVLPGTSQISARKKFDSENFYTNKIAKPFSAEMNKMLFLKGFIQLLEKFGMQPTDQVVEQTPFLHDFLDFIGRYNVKFPQKKFQTKWLKLESLKEKPDRQVKASTTVEEKPNSMQFMLNPLFKVGVHYFL
jgi:hypothetical protein